MNIDPQHVKNLRMDVAELSRDVTRLRAELQAVTQANRMARDIAEDLRAELAAARERVAALEADRGRLRSAMLRIAQHGVSGDWFCGSCSYNVKTWIGGGLVGEPEPLCCLCRHADDAMGAGEDGDV